MRKVRGLLEGRAYLVCTSIAWCLGDGTQYGDSPLVKNKGYLPNLFCPQNIHPNLPPKGVMDFVAEREYPKPYDFYQAVENQGGILRKVSVCLARRVVKESAEMIFWCHRAMPLFNNDWGGQAMYANSQWGVDGWKGEDFWFSAYLRGEYPRQTVGQARQIFAVSNIANVVYVLKTDDPDQKIHQMDELGIEVVACQI